MIPLSMTLSDLRPHFKVTTFLKLNILKTKLQLHNRKPYLTYGMVLCLVTLTDLQTCCAGLSASAELLVYCASACNASRAWYCSTTSVCLSVCLSVYPMPVQCLNEWTYHTFWVSVRGIILVFSSPLLQNSKVNPLSVELYTRGREFFLQISPFISETVWERAIVTVEHWQEITRSQSIRVDYSYVVRPSKAGCKGSNFSGRRP